MEWHVCYDLHEAQNRKEVPVSIVLWKFLILAVLTISPAGIAIIGHLQDRRHRKKVLAVPLPLPVLKTIRRRAGKSSYQKAGIFRLYVCHVIPMKYVAPAIERISVESIGPWPFWHRLGTCYGICAVFVLGIVVPLSILAIPVFLLFG